MVCLQIESDHHSETNNTCDSKMDIDEEHGDLLKLKTIAGGSIIQHRPVFSPDGESVFVTWKNLISVYSTTTGEWLRNLEGPSADIVGMGIDLYNPKLLIACSSDGEVFTWKWKYGVRCENIILGKGGALQTIVNFNLISYSKNDCCAIVAVRSSNISLKIFDLNTGNLVEYAQLEESSPFSNTSEINVAVGPVEQHYVAITQGYWLYIIDLKTNKMQSYRTSKNTRFTCVECHPEEFLVATGDSQGQVIIWRNLFAQTQPVKAVYHWHWSGVNTIVFTESGTHFYSGGKECVLVKWTLDRPTEMEFLPRMSEALVHLSISNENKKIAVSLNDNGILVLNSQHSPLSVVQNFTWVPSEKNPEDIFPAGMTINPRNSCLVLNGRTGHIQSFSPHSRKLLYNLDVTAQNKSSGPSAKGFYQVTVTNVSLTMDWLATGESWNDKEHTTETRMKFWSFEDTKNIFSLNTVVELPHERGIACLEFSSPYSIANLVCASAGLDHNVKIWAVDDRENAMKTAVSWVCISQAGYKNQPIKSLAFSQDSSLLATGFGNTLCVWSAEKMQLKCALAAPASFDGAISKVVINLPEADSTHAVKCRKEKIERRKSIILLLKSMMSGIDQKLFENVSHKMKRFVSKQSKTNISNDITNEECELVYNMIMAHTDIDLEKKLMIFQSLGIQAKSSDKSLIEFCVKKQTLNASLQKLVADCVNKISLEHQLSTRCKLDNYQRRKREWKKRKSHKSILDVFGTKVDSTSDGPEMIEIAESSRPVNKCAQINNIVFGTGENAHLVIVCTENRLLIWNLLTLRLKTALRMRVTKIAIDSYTGLIATFTADNELFIFTANVPMPLYHRKKMPKVFGAAWIPRRFPKPHSLNLDWQATSQLFFLNSRQELQCLISENDVESQNLLTPFMTEDSQPMPVTVFGAQIAKQITEAVTIKREPIIKGAIAFSEFGKSCVTELISFSPHTMAPVHRLCDSFLRAMLMGDKSEPKPARTTIFDMIKYEDSDLDTTNDIQKAIKTNDFHAEIVETPTPSERADQEKRLKILSKERFEITL